MADNIRVALVCTSVNQLGGKVSHLKSLYRNLNGGGFEIFIFCCSKVEDELRGFMIGEGVWEKNLVFLSRFKKWMVIPFVLELKRSFLEKRIDIVHTFQIQSDVFGVIAARLTGIKYIFSLFESKIIPDNISLIKHIFYKIINRIIRKWVIKTVVVSEGLRKELVLGKFRSPDSIVLIRIGFDISDKYKNCKCSFEKLRGKNPLIGTVSRLSKEKGVDHFIAAMPLILQQEPNAKFIIASNGSEEEKLKVQAQKLGVDSKVMFTGWVEDVPLTINSIDIFVMPSRREGCPVGLLEALSLCRPVVASKIEGIVDIIDDGKDGLLVDASDSEELSKKILFLCREPEKAILLGESGRQKVSTKFTIEREMSQFRQLYLDAVEQS